MSNLLIKKTNLEVEKVFPKTYIHNITDKSSNKTLALILNSFNMYFLSYTGNISTTRCLVPMVLRKKGLWITYVKYDGNVCTEWYDASDIDDESWGDSSNWRIGSNTLTGDITISSNGNWVINGTETEFNAVGEKGNTPLIRIANNRLLVSYDLGDTYKNVTENPVYTQFKFNSLTNTYQVSYDLGSTWLDVSDEKVYYKFRYNGKTNTHLVSTDLGQNWTDVSSNKVYYQFRTNNNRLLVSTDLGTTWENCSEPIAAWFRWADTSGTNNVGKVLISRDLLNWEDLSPVMTNNLYIKGYVAAVDNLPPNAAIGDIYMVGPTYDESDTILDYPHYRMWVKLSSGWVDNGEYLSNVLIVLTTGLETGITMSLKAITNCLDIEQLKIYSYTNTGLVKTGDNMIDISRCLKGKYFSVTEGSYELLEYSDWWCSPFIPVSPNTTYYTKNIYSVLWFDKNYKKLSHVQPVTDSVVSPESVTFAICNIIKDTAYFGLNENPVITTFWQTLSEACKTNSVFPYSGRYAFSKEKIENGATTVIKNIYIDVEAEEGYSYVPASIFKDAKKIYIYKKVKDVTAVSDNFQQIMILSNAKQIGNSKFYMLTSGKSWAIVCFDELVSNSFNNWDYNGFELDERVTKGGIWSNFVFSDQLSDLNSQSLKLSGQLLEFHSQLSELSEQTVDEEASEIAVNYFEGASSFTPLYISSVFSGYGFNIGSIDKSFRYLQTKVKVSDWVSAPKAVSKVLVQIRENTKDGSLLFSKLFEIKSIAPGITKDISIDLGEELNFSNKSLYLIIRFDSYAVLLKANSSTNPNTDILGCYFTSGNIVEGLIGNTASGKDNQYRYVYFKLYSSLIMKTFLTDEQISNIESRLDIPLPEPEIVDISLPDKIYAIVGDTLQLFFRGIIKAVDPYKYNIVVSCLKGRQYPRYFEYTPTIQDVGETNFTITVKDNNRKVISTKQCLLVTKDTVASPSNTINVACFGDSLTTYGIWCKEAHRRLAGSDGSPVGKGLTNIQFVGSKKIGTTGYFGVGGWTWDSYTTQGRPAYRFQVSGVSSLTVGAVYTNNGNTFTIMEINITEGSGNILCSVSSLTPTPTDSGTLTKSSGTGDSTITFSSYSQDTQNPLWDYNANKMTFIPYANAVANGTIDVVYVLLSWNGQIPGKENFSDVITKIKNFADTLHSEFPNAKLKIMGIQVPSVNGGMGANYGATGTSYADGYGMVVTALNQNKAYQDFANSEGYKDFVEFVNISAEFDTEYNMPYTETNVNTRSTIKENRGTNGVHPSTEGYYQIADTVFRNFIANFCQ